jgi:GNAT superfamily N-acetyltransferase
MTITYAWRGDFESAEVNAFHAEAFDHAVFADEDWDWKTLAHRYSLGWVCARDGKDLVGFVNVAWDGAVHAFILDTGIGAELVAVAVTEARAAGCEWLHVDFEDHLRAFYSRAADSSPRTRD